MHKINNVLLQYTDAWKRMKNSFNRPFLYDLNGSSVSKESTHMSEQKTPTPWDFYFQRMCMCRILLGQGKKKQETVN